MSTCFPQTIVPPWIAVPAGVADGLGTAAVHAEDTASSSTETNENQIFTVHTSQPYKRRSIYWPLYLQYVNYRRIVATVAVRTRASRRKAKRSVPSATTLTEDAYRLIKWRITTVQLAPGATFTESELAEQLELSRTPLREALLLLRREGFVVVEGRSGYRVSPVTIRDVHDLASVRRSLEGDAAYAAASRLIEPGQVTSLGERTPSPLVPGDVAAASHWIEADRRFHLALAVDAGNQHLVAALDPVLEKSARLLHLLVALDPKTSAVAHDHVELLLALQERDAERARRVAVEGIGHMEAAVSRALMASPSLLSARLVVDTPRNEFYLDVTPAQASARYATGLMRAARPQSRDNTAETVGVKK
jgi:DNA-binding GntR family transcriptional regulator